jgi:hypothetical protein
MLICASLVDVRQFHRRENIDPRSEVLTVGFEEGVRGRDPLRTILLEFEKSLHSDRRGGAQAMLK